MPFATATLVSPRAYIAPSVQIYYGSIIEPMAVVHTGVIIAKGCIISAGAVVNHGVCAVIVATLIVMPLSANSLLFLRGQKYVMARYLRNLVWICLISL